MEITIPGWFFYFAAAALCMYTLNMIAAIVVKALDLRRDRLVHRLVREKIEEAIVKAEHVHLDDEGVPHEMRPN